MKVDSKKDAVLKILKLYKTSEVCMGELLHSVKITNLSVQDVVDVFATVMHSVEDDSILHIKDGETVTRGIDK